MVSDNVFVSALCNGQPLKPTDSNVIIAEWTAEGTPINSKPEPIAPLHKHNSDDEAWYILEGSLGFQIGDEIMEASAGQAVIVPKGIPHTYWNPNVEPAKYLIIMTAKISSLIDTLHDPTQRDFKTMEEIFREHDSELL